MPARRRRSRWLALTLAAVLGSCGIAAAAADARPSKQFFGVVPTSIQKGDVAKMAESGVGTMRLMLFWPTVEASPGSYRWGPYDGIVADAAAHGIRVFPTLYGTPGWANFIGGRNGCGATCAPSTDASRRAFAAFAQEAAERYGPGGTFWRESGGECGIPSLCPKEPPPCACTTPVPITSWQIWNEQNSSKYFRPEPNPASYARLLGASAGAIRAVDPNAEIVVGGIWGPPGADSVIPTTEYLRALYETPGVEDTFDAIAIHPYAPTVRGVIDQVKIVRKVVRRLGDGAVDTWVTELGWASGGPRDSGLVKTRKAQARLLTLAFKQLIKKRRAWRIRGITWYTWRDAGPGESDCIWCPKAGLRTLGGAEKPAGRAFRTLAIGGR